MSAEKISAGKDLWSLNPEAGKGIVSNIEKKAPNVIIGVGCKIIGDLTLEGNARIDGSIEGEIKIAGELIIGESAVINAKIYGRAVQVFGRFDGDLLCSEKLEIHAGACVTGSISSPRLLIEDGVVFEGSCTMNEAIEAEGQEEEKVVNIESRAVEGTK